MVSASVEIETAVGWLARALVGQNRFDTLLPAALKSLEATYPAVRWALGAREASGNYRFVASNGTSPDELRLLVEAQAAEPPEVVLVAMAGVGPKTLEPFRELLVAASASVREFERLEHVGSRDALTGVYNRGALSELLSRERERSARYGRTMSVLYIDVDRFKDINDAHGHRIGDEALKLIADVLEGCRRTSDVVGRWGGDEFLVLLPDTRRAGAEELARRIDERLAGVNGVAGVTMDLKVSIGAASLDEGDPVELADQRMLGHKQARHGGRDGTRWSPGPMARA